MAIWNQEIECMPLAEKQRIQCDRLQKSAVRVYNKVPLYKKKFDDAGITPEAINSIDDLQKLPFTVKEDLRDNYPFNMFAEPLDNVVRVHASSGTTGKMTVVGYTANDIGVWAEVMARTLAAGDVSHKDIVQNAYGYGLFTGGLGIHIGAEKIGAVVIPISGGNTKRQLEIACDFGSTAITCTPSFMLYLVEVAAEMGVDLQKDTQLKVGFYGAEPWTREMADEVYAKTGILPLDIYGLSEVIGPGVSFECPERNGMHICDDHFIPEIINPETGDVLPAGESGELVFTCVTKEAFPLIRYRTRDITKLTYEPCACGRTSVRMDKVSGRTDDMLIIRGVNVFPSQIESVILKMDEIEPHYQLVVSRVDKLDELELQVEVGEQYFSDEIKVLEGLRKKIKSEVESTLGIRLTVKLCEPKSIERSIGKAKRVIDNRKL